MGYSPHLHQAWSEAESRCIKCGFCLPVCPTYQLTRRESASPRGRLDLMYAAAKGELRVEEIEGALALCLGCLACETACPSGIRFGAMLEAERADLAALRRASPLKRFLLATLLDSPRVLGHVARALAYYRRSGLQRLVRATGLLNLLAPSLARLERRTPPIDPPVHWRPRARALGMSQAAAPVAGAKVAALLTGCVMDAAYGSAHLATVRVLKHNGWGTWTPPSQGCCGALALHAGELGIARSQARRNIAAFEAGGAGAIVVNSAGCGAAMKDYDKLLESDPAWRERARAFSARVADISEFLARLELKAPGHAVPWRVAYDDPCHLVHAQRIRDQPRALLRRVPGLELVNLPEAEWCCGGAGSYTLTQPAMSARVLERKMAHVASCRPDVLASGNPGCLMQLAAGVAARGLPIRVLHPIELLALAYEGGAEPIRPAAAPPPART